MSPPFLSSFIPHETCTHSIEMPETLQTPATEVKSALRLLDLPLDILEEIIKQVTHTNDLTAIALTCSVLHSLVVPYIYARFDIVWPDSNPAADSRVGVDALTYGLATLVMSEDVFGQSNRQSSQCSCPGRGTGRCGHRQTFTGHLPVRRGNYFAQYTRKFSLGNGPKDWVQEYMISRETGKMLGTLVAIAIGRMRNLENFHWDMPTGVLRDVWLALSSLANRDDGQNCKLERVWVRWHDNRDNTSTSDDTVTAVSTRSSELPSLRTRSQPSTFNIPPYPRVVFPTFSALPPLKSLSVLDIDEFSYVQELSVLIQRSLQHLEELRIGLAKHAIDASWAIPSTNGQAQVDGANDMRKSKRIGGLLETLFSQFHAAGEDALKDSSPLRARVQNLPQRVHEDSPKATLEDTAILVAPTADDDLRNVEKMTTLFAAHGINREPLLTCTSLLTATSNTSAFKTVSKSVKRTSDAGLCDDHPAAGKHLLSLQVLEFEGIHLSKSTLCEALDWCKLKSITLLGCQNTEGLWRVLRKRYAPSVTFRDSLSFLKNTSIMDSPQLHNTKPSSSMNGATTEYKLRLTQIYTDTVSVGFLAFIKDTLAPDTLETLFLRQRENHTTAISLEQIYRHVIRRHRGSLARLLISSDTKADDTASNPALNSNWRRWCMTREMLTCIMSSRMKLREISLSLYQKDWHFFLQRLPEVPSLRSLHVTHIADYVHGRKECREAAQQIVDVVALRPEIQLCFVGVHRMCFEIIETAPERLASRHGSHRQPEHISHTAGAHREDVDNVDNDSDLDIGEDVDTELAHVLDTIQPTNSMFASVEDQSDSDSCSNACELDSWSDDDDDNDNDSDVSQQKSDFKLREILFYDDKIAIFKAKHGKL